MGQICSRIANLQKANCQQSVCLWRTCCTGGFVCGSRCKYDFLYLLPCISVWILSFSFDRLFLHGSVVPCLYPSFQLLAWCKRRICGYVYFNHSVGGIGHLVKDYRQCDHGICCGSFRFEHGDWLCERSSSFCIVLRFVNLIVQEKIRLTQR